MSKMELSRRDFLKASAVSVAGLAAMGIPGVLAEEPKNAKPIINEPKAWDHECDVLAIGTGTSMYGVIKAANAGLDVLVIDANMVAGGAAGFSGATLWLPNNRMAREQYGDSREKAMTYLKHGIGFSNTNEEDINAFLDNIDPMLDFIDPMLRSTSFDLGCVVSPNLGDYHASWEGGLPIGRSIDWRKGKTTDVPTDRHAWRQAYIEAAEREGAKIMLQTTAKKFVFRMQENEVPEVLGVIAEDKDGNEIAIKAKKAVLLASGGFEWNQSYVKDYLDQPDLYPFSFNTNKGYGLEMAISVGARLTNMSRFWGATTLKDAAIRQREEGSMSNWMHARYKPHSMMVNKTGRRFMNEACDYNTAGRMFNRRESYLNNELENLPCWMIFDQQHLDNGYFVISYINDELDERGVYSFVKSANTLEELADMIGVPKESLTDEVARFNTFVENGKDEDFHRGEDPHDLIFFQNPTTPHTISRTLGKIEQGPFYAVEVAPMTLGTCGGPKINKHAQVMHISGEPIARLYACGNVTGFGGPGSVYGGAGGTLGPGFVMGYAAAAHMVESKPEDWA